MKYLMKTAHAGNYAQTERRQSQIKFIVLHYTATDGATVQNCLDYAAREKYGASAHYYVDAETIGVSVPELCIAWHCGGSKYRYSKGGSLYGMVFNSNSIGIEMCCRKIGGKWVIDPETVKNAAALTAQLMEKYHIDISHVVRHYDVTGKECPAPMVEDVAAWEAFKLLSLQKEIMRTEEKEMETMAEKRYQTLEEIPAGEMRETVKDYIDRGIIKGNGTGLDLSLDMVRCLVFLHRTEVANK